MNEQSQLLIIQQEELRARNEEIYRLRTICNGSVNPVSIEEANLKNTIKHLRGELGRYNSMMSEILKKMVKAEETIKKY